jgi:hypothetical protein
MTPPDTKPPMCSKHHARMVPHTLQTWELLADGNGQRFQMPKFNLPDCSPQGGAFYTLEVSGDLTPYLKADQQ